MRKARVFLATLLLSLFTASLYAQNMTYTIAGVGTSQSGGFSGDGGPANLAELSYPNDVCMDSVHNIYICDAGNARIRKIDAQTNIITTIAGNGVWGYDGDGGLATNAKLYARYLCADASGNLYVAGGKAIRHIDAQTGIITTVAGNGVMGYSGDGGLAVNASINNVHGICMDNTQNLYFADYMNNRIRRIDAQTGIITTVAGTDSAGYTGNGGPAVDAWLYRPTAVTIDKGGNILFADQEGERIRKINIIDGKISTIAGIGGNAVTENLPATQAGLGHVYGIVCDPHGDVYFNDESCSCRKIDSVNNYVYRVAGQLYGEGYNGDSGISIQVIFLNPMGLCIDPSNGDVYIADKSNNRIRKVVQPNYGMPDTIPGVGGVGEGEGSVEPSAITSPGFQAEPDVVIYPNPAVGEIVLQASDKMQSAKVQVTNVMGSIVYNGTIDGKQLTIDMSGHASGTYYILFDTGTRKATAKIVLTN